MSTPNNGNDSPAQENQDDEIKKDLLYQCLAKLLKTTISEDDTKAKRTETPEEPQKGKRKYGTFMSQAVYDHPETAKRAKRGEQWATIDASSFRKGGKLDKSWDTKGW